MNASIPTAVADLRVGDTVLTNQSGKAERPVTITRLVPLFRTNRTRVYVKSVYVQRSLRSDWRFGTFVPAHLVNKVN